MKTSYAVIGFIMLLLTAAACSSGLEPGDVDVETAVANSGESAIFVTQDPQMRVNLGETVSGDGYSMVLHELADPATPGAAFSLDTGDRLIAVRITLRNDSNEAPLPVNLIHATLLAGNGLNYGSGPTGIDGEIATADLAPGEEMSGWFSFALPEDVRPFSFAYQVPFGVELESRLR